MDKTLESVGKRSNLAIWKINRDHFLLAGVNAEENIETIVSSFNKRKNKVGDNFEPVKLLVEEISKKKVQIYHKQRKNNGWESFIGGVVETDNNIFWTLNNDFLCFIYDKVDIFLITAGAGFHAIQGFIDDDFPLDTAKKVFVGDFSHSEVRDLTGASYSKSENYRRNYTFSHQESFGKIWKKLTGRIDEEILKEEESFSLIFDPKKKLNAEMKSSFTFKKKISFNEVIDVINAIQRLPELTIEKQEKFKFLDTLKEIKNKEIKERLLNILLKKFYSILVSENFEEADNYDFCHPTEIFSFFSGTEFKINNKEIGEGDYPSAGEVIKFLKNNNLVDLSNFESFKEIFCKMKFEFKKDDGGEPITTYLYKFFHGEIEDNKIYFYIDTKWYEPKGNFLDSLLNDFIYEVFNGFLSKEISLIDWIKNTDGKYLEDNYNKDQSRKDGFYIGDKNFVKTGRGKIELFDLLFSKDGKVYIIQVKGGFGASIRDACSQIEMAAEVIESDIKNDKKILKKYYQDWDEKNNISEKDFINLLISHERIYVLANATSKEFTRENFENKKFESSIALFEVLGLKYLFRGKGYNLIMQNIKQK